MARSVRLNRSIYIIYVGLCALQKHHDASTRVSAGSRTVDIILVDNSLDMLVVVRETSTAVVVHMNSRVVANLASINGLATVL